MLPNCVSTVPSRQWPGGVSLVPRQLRKAKAEQWRRRDWLQRRRIDCCRSLTTSHSANPGGMIAAKSGLRVGVVTKIAFSLAMGVLGVGLQHVFAAMWPSLCGILGPTLATAVVCGFIPASFYWGNSLFIGWRTGWNNQSSPSKIQPVSALPVPAQPPP